MGTTFYPPKYKNVLIEAGLIGAGELVITALVAGNRTTTLDEESDTWVQTEEYETDYRGAGEYLCPVVTGGNRIVGDWRSGLSQDVIKIIREECGVREFTPDTSIYIYHGRRLDLSNPKDMAEYKIISKGNVVAPNRDQIQNRRFYFVSTKEVEDKKKQVRKVKMEAMRLVEKLLVEEKRQVLEIANYLYKIGLPSDMSDEQVRDTFIDMAMDGHHRRITDSYNLKDKHFHLLLFRAIDHGVLTSDGERGAVSWPGAKTPLATDHFRFIEMMKRDNGMYKSVQSKLDSINEASTPNHLMVPDAPTIVKSYDTTIYSEADIAYWGLGACKQYLEEKGVELNIDQSEGVDKWRKAVVSHYRGEESPFFLKTEKGEMYDFSDMPETTDTKPDKQQDGSGELSTKLHVINGVKNWKRDKCKEYLNGNKALMKENMFPLEVSGNSSTEKWQAAVMDFMDLLDEKTLQATLEDKSE